VLVVKLYPFIAAFALNYRIVRNHDEVLGKFIEEILQVLLCKMNRSVYLLFPLILNGEPVFVLAFVADVCSQTNKNDQKQDDKNYRAL